MSDPVHLGVNSVQWLEGPNELDRSFIDEVFLIPERATQGIMVPIIESAVEKLFEYSFPQAWAYFVPFKEYHNSVKRLFRRKLLTSFDPEVARDLLDNYLEDEENEDGAKIYEMLQELDHLNVMLEEIYNKILSCLKP